MLKQQKTIVPQMTEQEHVLVLELFPELIQAIDQKENERARRIANQLDTLVNGELVDLKTASLMLETSTKGVLETWINEDSPIEIYNQAGQIQKGNHKNPMFRTDEILSAKHRTEAA